MPEQRKPWNEACIEPVDPDDRLAHVRHCSPFAAGLIDRHPEWMEQLTASGRLDEISSPHKMRAREWVSARNLDDGLRSFRNQEMLRIVWRDLCGLATLGEVFSDLTTLAEICLGQAVEAHHAQLSEKHGVPHDEAGKSQQAVVIGLGKLGGGELNLSSDIDLLFCFPAGGKCDGPRGLSHDEYFAKLSRAVISTLGEVRPSGFCFRVDTRLRPFGQAGPIACSFSALEQYYQREGRDWERYALVKARPVTGDIAAGERLLETLRPFVYRRYIDFGAIEALREMQSLIRSETSRADNENDIKRGPGGIREIEFLAQGFQLLRGGRDPRLQSPRLAEALDAISVMGLLSDSEVETLRGHYLTLRHIENRLQAMHDQQTHRIPRGEDLERLVKGMGMDGEKDFTERLARARREVSRIFDETWAGPDEKPGGAEETESTAGEWHRRWLQWRDSEESEAGPELTPAPPLRSFLTSLARRPTGQRAGRRLDRFMPMLLQHFEEKDLSEETISRLLDLVLVTTRRSAYLALLAENPGALDRTVELFDRSHWVAKRVARFPELLDELIDPALGQHIPDREALEEAVERKLEMKDDEAALAGLNYLKQAASLRLAVAWLERRVDVTGLQHRLSELAEVMIGATMQMAHRELERRHGVIEDAGVAVIGYGSLGARELAFGSDLDLVFLYLPGNGESVGERPLAAERWFARLAQRMVGFLTALTPSGKLYEIDTRLRPNGQSGLLVSSIDAFRTYQDESAWTWEAQALTRARAVAGDDALMQKFEDIRLDSLRRERDPKKLGTDLLDMRERIRQSHGSGSTSELAIKHGPGGLVDIGFIAQLGVLALASELPDVAVPTGAAEQLEALSEAGWLEGKQLRRLHRRLRALRKLRIAIELDGPQPRGSDVESEGGEAVAAILEERAGG